MLQSYRASNRQAMNGLLSGDQMLFCASASAAESHLVAHCFPAQATARVGLDVAAAAVRVTESNRDKAALEVNVSSACVLNRSCDYNQRPLNINTVVSQVPCLS
jgi:hypothetical protein